MSINSFYLIVILLHLASCSGNKEGFLYEYLVVHGDGIKLWSDTVFNINKTQYEEGRFELKGKDGNILESGTFIQGLKDGKWIYSVGKDSTFTIDWQRYTDPQNKILTVYPKDWEVSLQEGRLFQAVLPIRDTTDVDEFFVILSHDKHQDNLNVVDYQDLYNQEMFKKDSVISYINYSLYKDNRQFFYNEYTVLRNGKRLNVYSFLGEQSCCIYDLSLVANKDEEVRNRIIFFDIIKNLRIQGERFFSPFHKAEFDKIDPFQVPKPQA